MKFKSDEGADGWFCPMCSFHIEVEELLRKRDLSFPFYFILLALTGNSCVHPRESQLNSAVHTT